jgi:hypothetical protein
MDREGSSASSARIQITKLKRGEIAPAAPETITRKIRE